MEKIDHDKLATVAGGAKGAQFNPFDPFGVGAYWAGVANNATGAWMAMMPLPFQTPISPLPFY